MSVNVYKDLAKTVELQASSHFVGDGVTRRFFCAAVPKEAYIDGIKTVDYTVADKSVRFNLIPAAGVNIAVLPENSLDFYILGDASGSDTVSIYVDTTTDVYMLSHDTESNDVGELLFSLNNVDYYPCIELTTGTSIQVYVKATLAAAINKLATLVHTTLVVVDTTTPLNSSGYITVDFSVPGGSIGGVEVYENL